jgi:hypothetical protein
MIDYFEEGIFDLDRLGLMIHTESKGTDVEYDRYIQRERIGIQRAATMGGMVIMIK